jgi:hypothetical protein|tara:strand:- start:2041 stop:2706 length:666 start_codon:yes stop_codon:yes gene_type:complete
MGTIKKILANIKLPDRELHNSRLFVDLSEQVHIHFRELRTVYSVPEFFEYANIISRSAKDLKRYLLWHPNYKEQQNFENETIALGAEQQTTPLRKSPNSHRSTYFDDRLQIELQGEEVIDEIHVHYRDYRFVMNQETFRIWVDAMIKSVQILDDYLSNHTYERIEHPFRREVVKDKYYEKRNWVKRKKIKIPLKKRIEAFLLYIGGNGLVNFVTHILRFFR